MYSEALKLIAEAPKKDLVVEMFSQVFEFNLQMCLNALRGVIPAVYQGLELRKIAKLAAENGFSDVQIEAWFLIFDSFDSSHDEVVEELLKLESSMDKNTLRRWCIRKARHLSHTGHISDAYDLLLSHAVVVPENESDNDDSLCALLVEFGRIATELGKYSDAVDIYNQAVNSAKSAHNQGLALIRLSNALERMSRPAQADKRRIEYFTLIKRDYPTQCASCSLHFGKEPKFLIPCCKTIIHSECLRQVVSDIEESEASCPFCSTVFRISDVVDPTSVEGRKYKRSKKGGGDGRGTMVEAPSEAPLEMHASNII